MKRAPRFPAFFACSLLLLALGWSHAAEAEPVPAARPAPANAGKPAPRVQAPAADADAQAARELQVRQAAQRWHDSISEYSDDMATAKGLVLTGAILGVIFVVLVLSLQLACWFALVEADFARCARLTVLLIIPTGCAWFISMLLTSLAISSLHLNWLLLLVPLWIGAQGLCGYLTRRVLECRWRSVVTIYTMFNLTGSVMTTIAVVMGITIFLGLRAFDG